MAWNFIKKLAGAKKASEKTPADNKPVSEKTDEKLAKEIEAISPKIFEQAKLPEQRALVIKMYRQLLASGIDVNDNKAVKKWFMKHPELMSGGDIIEVKTVHREQPKIGRNDLCPCGSGKKYKKCCGK